MQVLPQSLRNLSSIISISPLTIILIISASCSTGIDPVLSERSIVVDPETEVLYQPSLLFDSIQLIPLETNSKSVFAECRKLMITDDTFYIWDPSQYSILAFDMKGRFKFNTASFNGRGPGEYLNILDFDISPFTNNLEILEPFSRIAVYRPDSSFLEYHHLPQELMPLQGFKILTEDLFIFHGRVNSYQGKTLLIYSKSRREIVKTMLHLPNQLDGFPSFNPFGRFYSYDDSLFFTFNYLNHVLRICPQELSTTNGLSFSFSEKTFQSEKIPESTTRAEKLNYLDENGEKFAYVERIFESDKYCWVFFIYREDYRFARYNKENFSLITAYGKFGEKYQLPPPHAFDEESLYYVSPISYLSVLVDPELLDGKSLQVFNNIREDENPVIIRYFY